MARFLVDEDMPRSTAPVLREAGFEANDVRDIGLRGRGDVDIFDAAQLRGAILLTADKGFANIVRFPPGTHAGVVVARLPNELTTGEVNRIVLAAIQSVRPEDLDGSLVIVQMHRLRIRRPTNANG